MRQKDGRLAWSAPRPFAVCHDESGMVSSNAERSDSVNLSASCPACFAKERLWGNLFALSRKPDRHTKVSLE